MTTTSSTTRSSSKTRLAWNSRDLENADYPSNTPENLRPILNSLRLLGSHPTFADTSKLRSIKTVRQNTAAILLELCQMVCLALLHADVFHLALRTYYLMNKSDFYTTLANFVRTMAGLVTCDCLLLRTHKLNRLLRWSSLVPGPEDEAKSIKRMSRAFATACWIFLIAKSLLECLKVRTQVDLKSYLNSHWYGFSKGDQFFGVWLDIILHQVMMHGHLIFPISLYLCMTKTMNNKFVRFNALLHAAEHSPQLTASDIQKFRMKFCELSSIVELMDDIFSSSTLLWYSIFLFSACVEATRIFTSKHDAISFCSIVIDLLFMTSWFIAMSFMAANLTEEAHESLPFVHRLSVRQDVWDKAFFCQTSLLTSQLSTPLVALSGWKFFDIDRGVILTLGGALLTYIVLIIQMMPSPDGEETKEKH